MLIYNTETKDLADCCTAVKESWAGELSQSDVEGFAVMENGQVVLLDECGRYAYAPAKYQAVPLSRVGEMPLTAEQFLQYIDGAHGRGEEFWAWAEVNHPNKSRIQTLDGPPEMLSNPKSARLFETEHPIPPKSGYYRFERQWLNCNAGVRFRDGGFTHLADLSTLGKDWNVSLHKPGESLSNPAWLDISQALMVAAKAKAHGGIDHLVALDKGVCEGDFTRLQPPLTREELVVAMKRHEETGDTFWVYIVCHREFPESKLAAWKKTGYFKIQRDHTDGEGFCCGFPGVGFVFEFNEQGKAWDAYAAL